MPTLYDWEAYNNLIYQHYIAEGHSLEETQEILLCDFDFELR